MKSPALGPFWSLVAIQSGVISRRQAITAGVKPATIDNRLRSGQWRSLQRGVYLISADTPDRDAELWAVVLRAGPPAALSYTTAAELFGLDRPSRRLIHVTVPINRKVGSIRGATVHHSRSIDSSRALDRCCRELASSAQSLISLRPQLLSTRHSTGYARRSAEGSPRQSVCAQSCKRALASAGVLTSY